MSPPSQSPHRPCGCGPVSTLHTSLAAAGSSLDPTGRLDGADEMHGREGLNLHVGPAEGARWSALSCELSGKVIFQGCTSDKAKVEGDRGSSKASRLRGSKQLQS